MTSLEQIALWCCTGFVIGELLWKVGCLIYIIRKQKIRRKVRGDWRPW